MLHKDHILISAICEVGFIRNKDNIIANVYLSIYTSFNIKTNQYDKPTFTVKAFENPNTYGYHTSTWDNYNDARKAYDDLFVDETHIDFKR